MCVASAAVGGGRIASAELADRAQSVFITDYAVNEICAWVNPRQNISLCFISASFCMTALAATKTIQYWSVMSEFTDLQKE
jgi:hypothetical protein